ncbi:unnamed protein product [Owenia fusiformis]|uniref:Uncharacterized protein n=1 Tax=Owenia fusiformis TaxID=6347 RepID=A0A8J1UXD2_OWEFU|nr:unnamed protein product [Owenia fusiformis]
MPVPQRRLNGVTQSLWVIVVVILALVPKTESITVAEKQAIKKGLQTGKEILGLIADHKFHETLTKVATEVKGFLGALGPFIGLVMTFVPSADSAELEFMKNMMTEIDNHFDRVDSRFNDVERLIKWTETAVKFGEIETALNALEEEYRLFYKSTASSENVKELFIKRYDSNYRLAGTKLYQALVNPGGTFNENLGQAVMRYTKNDRKKTEDFLLGIFDMIFQAIRLEAGYHEMIGFTTIKEERNKEWETRVQKVREKQDEIDVAVMNSYHAQSKDEILDYARDNSGMSNEQLSKGLLSLLEKKYYWRVWFVLIYNPITGSNKHTVKVCDGHLLFRQYGRNIVIASKDKAQPNMNLDNAKRELQKFSYRLVPGPFRGYLKQTFYGNTRLSSLYNAEEYFNKADKTSCCGFAVVDKNANVFYKASENRVANRDFFAYKMFMFG